MSYQCLFSTFDINGSSEFCRDADDFIAIIKRNVGDDTAKMVADIVCERQEMEDELEELKKDVILALAGIEDIYSTLDEAIEKNDFVKIDKLLDRLKEKTDKVGNLV
jgi:hypothetical protein